MSLITSGVKICERPRMYLRLSAGAPERAARPVEVRAMREPSAAPVASSLTRTVTAPRLRVITVRVIFRGGLRAIVSSFRYRLQHQLFLAGLEVVVVPKLLTGDNLTEMSHALSGEHVVHAQLARQPLTIEIGHLGPNGIDAQASRLAANVDRAVVHAVAEILAGTPANHHAAALHHKAGERTGIAAD